MDNNKCCVCNKKIIPDCCSNEEEREECYICKNNIVEKIFVE